MQTTEGLIYRGVIVGGGIIGIIAALNAARKGELEEGDKVTLSVSFLLIATGLGYFVHQKLR